MTTTSTFPREASGTGTGCSRLGPAKGKGEHRSPHTGSKSTRCPSISASTLEWPIQVSRSPLAGGFASSAKVVGYTGIGAAGPRRTRCSLWK